MIEFPQPPQIRTEFRRAGKIFLVHTWRDRPGAQSLTPLLMVHGAFHGWWAWQRWMGYFAALGFPAYALSVRGHPGGETMSAQQLCATGMEDYASDVCAALGLIGEPAILIGHSLGGLMAQMAARNNRAVRALALVGSAGPAALGPTRDFLWPEDTPLMFAPDRMRKSMFHEIADGDFAAIYARLVPESPRALNESGLAHVRIASEDVTAPVLVVSTQYDGIGLHRGQDIASYYKGAHVRVPGTSHDCLVEDAGLDAAHEVLRWILSNGFDRRG